MDLDFSGIAFAGIATLVAAGALFWHFQQVKKRPATRHDRLMAAMWAGVVVLAAGRLIFLIIAGDAPPPAGG